MPSPPSLGERVHYYSTTVKSRIIASQEYFVLDDIIL